jgi:hypothetical protein
LSDTVADAPNTSIFGDIANDDYNAKEQSMKAYDALHCDCKKRPSIRDVTRFLFTLAVVSSCAFARQVAYAEDQITVTSCPDQTKLPVAFQIDCSKVADANSKLLCKPFIENQACKVFPAYRQITGINLEEACPSIKYTIYDKENWPNKSGDAGGLTLKCAVEYMTEYSVNSSGKIGPYDAHELLHLYQATLGAIPYQHILFGPSQAEVMREIGDAEGYGRVITEMKESAATFERKFETLAARPGIDKCVLAEVHVEETLYLGNPKTVYAFYRKLVRSSVADEADRQARFNRMYDLVSEGKSRQFLLAHGCAAF